MRIYFASQSFYPHIGGVSTYLLNLQKELKKRGNEVLELHLRPSNTPNFEVIDGIEVHRVPKEPLDWEMLKGYALFKEAIYKECHDHKNSFYTQALDMPGYDDFVHINDVFGSEVRDLLNKSPADVIHIHDFQLLYLYQYVPRGTPLIFTWHIPLSKNISVHLKKYLVKHLVQYDKIIFSSPDYIQAAVGMGIPKEKCELIFPLCNTDLFRKMDVSRKNVFSAHGIRHEKKILMSVQRIDPKSGHEQLIAAMPRILEEVPDALLVFVGGKSMSNKISDARKVYEDRVLELIEKLGLAEKVVFTGNIDYNELPKVYNSCDVVALCSRTEGFGLSITEGMSCGKPILATGVGGIPLQVKDGVNGLLVPVGDEKATAEAAIKLLKDRKLREQMGEESLKIVAQNFRMDITVDNHVHIYNKLLHEKDETRRLEKMDIELVDAFITDFDRTLTDIPGEVREETLLEVGKLNTTHILATGRSLQYVKHLSERFAIWDCIVCENGSVIYFPKSRKTIIIDSGIMKSARELIRNSMPEAVFGEVLISIRANEMDKAKAVLKDLSKNLNYVMNVDEMMVLPKFVNKGQGVKMALDYLNLDAEKTIVVGDAENDFDLFMLPSYKVAVGNAHPRLKRIADEVTEGASSQGIIEIVRKLLKKNGSPS